MDKEMDYEYARQEELRKELERCARIAKNNENKIKSYNPNDITIRANSINYATEEIKSAWGKAGMIMHNTKPLVTSFDKGKEVKQIINLSSKKLTQEQINDGCENLSEEKAQLLCDLLKFEELPSRADLYFRANEISKLADGFKYAMVSGVPKFLISQLEIELLAKGIKPLHSFTELIEKSVNMHGIVETYKKRIHIGWVQTW